MKILNEHGTGGTQINFWWGAWLKVWNPYPYLFFPFKKKKKADGTAFAKLSKIGTHF